MKKQVVQYFFLYIRKNEYTKSMLDKK